MKITHTAILVSDIDAALAFYIDKLGFVKRSDSPMGDGDRWVTVSPSAESELEVVLQPPHWGPSDSAEERAAVVGKQPGFVIEVDDIRATIDTLKARGVEFTMELTEFPWGTQTAFKDLYGNVHVMTQLPASS